MKDDTLDAKLEEIRSLPAVEKVPQVPVSVAVVEAMSLLNRAKKDRLVLLQSGLKENFPDDLRLRALALQKAQSRWATDFKMFNNWQKEWRKAAPRAFKLRDELLHHYFFAFRNHPGSYASTQRIARGGSNDDMIQDLADLAKLGEANMELLGAINMDMGLIKKAMELAAELSVLYGKATAAKNEKNEALELKNKAYFHLKEAVDEIRRVGRYAFWKDPGVYNSYTSDFQRKRNKFYRKKNHL